MGENVSPTTSKLIDHTQQVNLDRNGSTTLLTTFNDFDYSPTDMGLPPQ